MNGRPLAVQRNIRTQLEVLVGRNELAAHSRCRKSAQMRFTADDIGIGLGAVAAVKIVRLLRHIAAGSGRQQTAIIVCCPAVPAAFGHGEDRIQRHAAAKQTIFICKPRLCGGHLLFCQCSGQLFRNLIAFDLCRGQAFAVFIIAVGIVDCIISDCNRIRYRSTIVRLFCLTVEIAVVGSRHIRGTANHAADRNICAVLVRRVIRMQIAVRIAGINCAGAVANHAANGAERTMAGICNISEGRAVDHGGVVARPAHDAANGVIRAAGGSDGHIRPAVGDKAFRTA